MEQIEAEIEETNPISVRHPPGQWTFHEMASPRGAKPAARRALPRAGIFLAFGTGRKKISPRHCVAEIDLAARRCCPRWGEFESSRSAMKHACAGIQGVDDHFAISTGPVISVRRSRQVARDRGLPSQSLFAEFSAVSGRKIPENCPTVDAFLAWLRGLQEVRDGADWNLRWRAATKARASGVRIASNSADTRGVDYACFPVGQCFI